MPVGLVLADPHPSHFLAAAVRLRIGEQLLVHSRLVTAGRALEKRVFANVAERAKNEHAPKRQRLRTRNLHGAHV